MTGPAIVVATPGQADHEASSRRVKPVGVGTFGLVMLVAAVLVVAGTLWWGHLRDQRLAHETISVHVQAIPVRDRESQVTAAAMSASGLIAVGTSDGHLVLSDTHRAAAPVGRWRVDSGEISAVTFSKDEQTIALLTKTRGIRVWWRSAGTVHMRAWNLPARLQDSYNEDTALALSPTGNLVVVGDDEDNSLHVFAARTGAPRARLDGPSAQPFGAEVVGFSADSRYLLGGYLGWSLESWRLPSLAKGPDLPWLGSDFAYTADGRYGSCAAAGHVVIVDGRTRQAVADTAISTSHEVVGTAVSADGMRVVGMTDDGELSVWDRRSHTIARRQLVRVSQDDAITDSRVYLSTNGQIAFIGIGGLRGKTKFWRINLIWPRQPR